MRRKIILVASLLYVTGLVAFAVLLLRARPAAGGLPEIGVGAWDADGGIAYISGRRLACEALSGDPRFSAGCTVPIDGDLLTVRVRPAGTRVDRFEGTCEAEHRGQLYRCRPGLHRGTVRTVALIEEPLGLSPAELEVLRDTYWVENGRFPDLRLLALITAFVSVAALVAWKPPAGTKRRAARVAYPLVGGLVFLCSCALLYGMTLYLWD